MKKQKTRLKDSFKGEITNEVLLAMFQEDYLMYKNMEKRSGISTLTSQNSLLECIADTKSLIEKEKLINRVSLP